MGKDLLIAEDHKAARELVLHALQDEGYNLVFAENGREAMRHLEQQQFTAALLDISLPHTSGTTICKQVKSDARHSRMPVILMSGALGARELAEQSSGAGADAYLPKPFSLRELRTVIRTFTKIREQATEIEDLKERLRESEIQLSAAQEASGAVKLDWRLPYHDFMKHARKRYFLHALALSGGNKSRLARRSGLDRSTLYVHFRNLGMLPAKRKKEKEKEKEKETGVTIEAGKGVREHHGLSRQGS